MAIKIGVIHSMSEVDRGFTNVYDFPIDDSLTTGVAWGKLLAIKGDGTSKTRYKTVANNKGATLVLADNTDDSLIPFTIAFDTSKKDIYGNLEYQLEDKNFFYPIGTNHETTGLIETKDTFLRVWDDTNQKLPIYNAVRQTTAGTVTVDTGVDAKAVVGVGTSFTTEYAVGDYIKIEGEVRQIESITDNTNLDVWEDFDADHTAVASTKESLVGKPIYATTSGDFDYVRPTTGKVWKVGEILGSQNVRLYFYNLLGEYK